MTTESVPGPAVRRATLDDLDALTPLFDAYRSFYGRVSDLPAARAFLAARLELGESVVFLAFAGNEPVGFTQLYPSFSSVSVARLHVLNDLFVSERGRRGGVGKRLLYAAIEYARGDGAVRLVLSTARTNHAAQALYESTGWKRDDEYLVYELPLG